MRLREFARDGEGECARRGKGMEGGDGDCSVGGGGVGGGGGSRQMNSVSR